MCPTKERNLKVSGAGQKRADNKGDTIFLGTPSPDPWDFSL